MLGIPLSLSMTRVLTRLPRQHSSSDGEYAPSACIFYSLHSFPPPPPTLSAYFMLIPFFMEVSVGGRATPAGWRDGGQPRLLTGMLGSLQEANTFTQNVCMVKMAYRIRPGNRK